MARQPTFDDFPYHGTSHSGMHDAIEHFSFAFIVEDNFTDGLSIQGNSVGLEDFVRTKMGNDCLVTTSAGQDYGASEIIGIDDGEVVPC